MPLNAATARAMIILSLKEAGVLGVGQTPLAEDINDCFTYLQEMTSQWQARRWMVPSLTDIFTLGNNQESNTIGVGGYWNVERPDQIKAGYFIQQNTGTNAVSIPLRMVYAYENYAQITVKDLNSFPQICFYDNEFNLVGGELLGNIFIWPIPTPAYEIHLLIKSDLGWPSNLNSVFTLPKMYSEAVRYNLAIRICSAYGVEAKSSTVTLAKVALNTIKVANTQIPEMTMPAALRKGKGFSLWNPDGY